MRLHELFEDPFTIPGISYVLNDPQDTPAAGQNGVTTQTANTAPNMSSGIQPQGAVQAGGAVPAMSSAGGSNTSNLAASAMVNQQLSKGSSITIPIGPAKQPQQMQITNVNPNDPITKQKMVTIVNKQKPNQPEQTYKFDDLANVIKNKGTI